MTFVSNSLRMLGFDGACQMEEPGKGQRNEMTALRRVLFWLFAVFAFGDVPLSAGGFSGSPDDRWSRISRELRARDLPARCSTLDAALDVAEHNEFDHGSAEVLAAEGDDNASTAFAIPSPIARNRVPVDALPTAGGYRQSPATGFSSRAPPVPA